jgi:DNA-binding NtrC family response regulator
LIEAASISVWWRRIATSETIAAGLFRRDLHHRLNVVSFSM